MLAVVADNSSPMPARIHRALGGTRFVFTLRKGRFFIVCVGILRYMGFREDSLNEDASAVRLWSHALLFPRDHNGLVEIRLLREEPFYFAASTGIQ